MYDVYDCIDSTEMVTDVLIWLAVPVFDMFELIVIITCTKEGGMLVYACAPI